MGRLQLFQRNSIAFAIGWAILNCFYVFGQQQRESVNTHAGIPKTGFSCAGRPAGYYADIETGCEVYHMCDGLGRRFDYICPNTTLFQQRMLICDHWYMVNCSKAESDYGANLLIGQRDKPFVSEAENELRTPRPDLLDRKYASDFSGESLRNQYKHTLTPLLNSILNTEKQAGRKTGSSASSSRWNNSPKTTTKPGDSTTYSNVNNPQFTAFDNRHSTSFVGSNNNNNDLGVSSSQDSRRTQNEAVFDNDVKPTVKNTPKPPSLDIEPPFFHTIQSSNNSSTTSSTPNQVHPAPSQFAPPFTKTTAGTPTIPNRFGNGATIQPTHPNAIGTTGSGPNPQRTQSKPNSVVNFGEKLHTTTVATNKLDSDGGSNGLVPVLPDSSKYPEPPGILLPPFEASNTIASATTQGPPDYIEWKLPASFLEPPFDENKSNGAVTIDDNANQVPVIPPQSKNSLSPSASIPIISKDLLPPLFDKTTPNPTSGVRTPSISLEAPILSGSSSTFSNHFVSPPSDFSSVPSLNSIPSVNDKKPSHTLRPTARTTTTTVSSKRQSDTTTKKLTNVLDLTKQFAVPVYTFPLENVQRPGYTEHHALNSFQIQIPDDVAKGRDKAKDRNTKPWYGENAKCPECHPSFLKPGSCEPCIKIR